MADSLAMPRVGETNIPFESTYPYLLEASLRNNPQTSTAMVIDRGMRRRTIEYVLDEWSELIELRKPDVLVIHVGIVDCAPRVFLRRERQFIENLRPRFLRDSILKYVHKNRASIVKFRKKVYVPSGRFQNLLDEIINRAKNSSIRSLIFVNIITPPAEMETRSPGFADNVNAYNRILQSRVNGDDVQLIDLNSLIDDAGGAEKLTVDGIHINEEGHRLLAEQIEELVLSLVAKNNTKTRAEGTN